MSIHWMTWVWDNSPYAETKLLIHLALADIAHKDGRFFASQTQLSTMARCSTEYIRKVIKELEQNNHLKIVTKGNGRGNATVYQLIGLETPNASLPFAKEPVKPQPQLGESDDLNPQLWDDKPPTLTPETPNSASIPTVLYNSPNTTVALAKAIAEKWWNKQEIKPLGKNAFWSLVEVCKAALKNGYTEFEVEFALDKLGIVPSMAAMDVTLKKHLTEMRQLDKSRRDREMAIKATKQHLEAISSPTNVPMPENVKNALRASGLLK
jgi:hypothetical protein